MSPASRTMRLHSPHITPPSNAGLALPSPYGPPRGGVFLCSPLEHGTSEGVSLDGSGGVVSPGRPEAPPRFCHVAAGFSFGLTALAPCFGGLDLLLRRHSAALADDNQRPKHDSLAGLDCGLQSLGLLSLKLGKSGFLLVNLV